MYFTYSIYVDLKKLSRYSTVLRFGSTAQYVAACLLVFDYTIHRKGRPTMMMMMKQRVLSFFSLAIVASVALFPTAKAWMVQHPTWSTRGARPTTIALSVQSFNLDATPLSDDHEQIGKELAASLQRMLDEEWMPQAVHVQMGRDVMETYIACRTSGDADVASILTSVAEKLTEHWDQYNAEAFVGAWDCANYVSDWLTTRAGAETCSCTHKIY